MKKIFYFFIVLIFFANAATAQYVNIPDNNFRAFLINKYPSCFDTLGRMDTTCNGILSETSVWIGGTNIVNLEGLQYFSNAAEFKILSNPFLQIIPKLPESTIKLFCFNNNLTKLPLLPNNLSLLDCSRNNLDSLPTLPSSLTELNINNNNFTNLTNLPPKLKKLYFSYNKLSVLPALNDSLIDLDFSYNMFTVFPTLPKYLINLSCSGNSFSFIDKLPETLKGLTVYSNFPLCISKVPKKLNYLYATYGSSIICLPNFPDSCVYINSYIGYITKPPVGICNPTNNKNNCHQNKLASVFAFVDNNNNGKFDSNEFPKANLKLSLSNSNYALSDKFGNAELYVDSLGTYIITPSTPSFYNAFPSSYTHNFNTYDTIIFDTFALKHNAIKDSISIVATAINNAARPGFNFAYKVDFENVGTTVLSPTINFNYDTNLLIFDSSSNSALVNNGSNLSVTLSNFVAGETGSFMIYFKVKTTAVLGSSLLCVASANAVSSSAADTVKTTIRGSFDPNDKFATQTLSLQEVTSKKYINYIIRFQNTGTDTAFSVVISDTLSAFLQASNYQFLSSSHPCKSGLRNGVLYFEFININLPDSGTNKNGSNGFVRFQILADESVTVGTIIPNKAYIYFDYNKGIVTNVATTTITNPLPLKLVSFSAKLESTNQLLTSWKTEDEINTSHFVIEKSFDGNIFFSIAEVAAKGNGNNPYSFLLENDTKNIFLRLKIVDKDGKWYYSNIIKVSVVKYNSISISPNPARDYIRVDNNIGGLKNANGYILNAHGIIVKLLILKQGIQLINISDLPAGIYYFHTDYDNKKFIIEK